MNTYYLRSNTVVEPLVNRWYAWPMLISPATAALITANLHVDIMESYLRMPKMHAQAVKNAQMRGGPFIDFSGEEKILEVQALLNKIKIDSAHILKLAKSIKQLNEILQAQADGHSLIPLYELVPDNLRGYVELTYDANSNPSFRLIESLLYRSQYYNKDQQEFMLSTLKGDYRSFVLSTPRLCFNNELVWKIPFANRAADTVFASREHGISKTDLNHFYNSHFDDNAANKALFDSLFTEQKPTSRADYKRYDGDEVRIRYLGHASVLLETKNTTILVDAMVSYGYPTQLQRFTYDDLPAEIDYVILTHSHQDHVMLEHLFQLRYKIKNIVVPKNVPGAIQDPSLKLMFKQLNFANVIELDELESIVLPDGEILGIPFLGEHGDLYINSKLAYVVRLQQKTILFAADSNNLEHKLYEHLKADVPQIDVAFLGMECDGAPMTWLYGPVLGKPLSRPMDQSRRLNGSDCEKILKIVNCFNCPQIYIYAMGQEPWLGYITSIEYTKKSKPIEESDELIKLCRADNRIAELLYAKKEIYLT
jgi:L-ascorbate metabolism protein UlaG (beta-lactamase superfamily)